MMLDMHCTHAPTDDAPMGGDVAVTQLTDDCFAAGGPLMTIEAALALVMPRLDG